MGEKKREQGGLAGGKKGDKRDVSHTKNKGKNEKKWMCTEGGGGEKKGQKGFSISKGRT